MSISATTVTDSVGYHTITHSGTSVNTSVTKNGVGSIRIPRGARTLASTSNGLAALNTRTDSWNVSAWINVVSRGNLQNIVSELTASNFYPLEWYYGSWYAGDAAANKLAYTHNIPLNQWIHMNAGFDVATGTFRMHIDGAQVDKKSLTQGVTPMVSINCTQGWEIGKRSSANVDSDMYLGSLEIDRGYFRPEGSFTPT